MYGFAVINRHSNQTFSFRVVFHNGRFHSSSVPCCSSWCHTLILRDTSRKSIETLLRHAWHHDIFWTVSWILEKHSRVVNIIHPDAVTIMLYLIKHRHDSIMRIRNNFVVVFLQCWFIPEVKCIYKPIIEKSLCLTPHPPSFLCYPDLVAMIAFETIFFSSTENFPPNFHASGHTFTTHWIECSSLWLGLTFCEGIVNLESWTPKNHLKCFCLLVVFGSMTMFKKSFPLTGS